MKLIHLLAPAAVLALWGCNDEYATPPEAVALRLTASIDAPVVRSAGVNDTQFAMGTKAYAFVFPASGDAVCYSAVELTANQGEGGFTSTTAMFFPSSGAVDVYVTHPAVLGTSWSQSAVSHTVPADQRTDADYASGDLLYASATGVAPTGQPVELTFRHLMAKARIALVASENVDLTGAELRLENIRRTASWTPDRSKTAAEQSCAAIGDATDVIRLSAQPSADLENVTYNACVLPPQSVVVNQKLLCVRLASGLELYWKNTAKLDFTQGAVVTLHVTVDPVGLNVAIGNAPTLPAGWQAYATPAGMSPRIIHH
jgi:hypothetical protein